MENIKKKQITSATRNEIIAGIAIPMYQQSEYPTSEEYTSVCKLLVETCAVLKDSCGNGYVRTNILLCCCMRKVTFLSFFL